MLKGRAPKRPIKGNIAKFAKKPAASMKLPKPKAAAPIPETGGEGTDLAGGAMPFQKLNSSGVGSAGGY